MLIEFDQGKQVKTQQQRGLDFNDAAHIFSHVVAEKLDERFEYGEPRFITAGLLQGRLVIVVWTPRNNARRVISMRYANEREIKQFQR